MWHSLLDQPGKHFGQSLTPVHRHAMEYVWRGDPISRQSMLIHGRPSLEIELLPSGFRGYPALLPPTAESSRLLEVLLLANCHANLAEWLSPISDSAVLQHLEKCGGTLGLARAEVAAMVIDTLPSVSNLAERWLWAQRDSVLDAAVRRIRSDDGLGCFIRFAAGEDRARLVSLASRRLQRSTAFEGRLAWALLSAGDPFPNLVAAEWRKLAAPAAKLHWGLRFERLVPALGTEVDGTIQEAMADPAFFATPQAGWVASVALERHGLRHEAAILNGIRRSKKPENIVRALGKIESDTGRELAVRILNALGPDLSEEAREAVAEALALLYRPN